MALNSIEFKKNWKQLSKKTNSHLIKFRRIILQTSSQSVRIERLSLYEPLVSSAKQKISYLEKSSRFRYKWERNC